MRGRKAINRVLDDVLPMDQWQITKQAAEQAHQFALESYRTNVDEYARRGQTDQAHIVEQIAQGKLAEIGTVEILKQRRPGIPISEPDFEVYSAEGKSYEADLEAFGYLLHIKSQSRKKAERFGLSWVFQKSDPLVHRPKLQDAILLTVRDAERIYLLWLGFAMSVINKYKPPRASALRATKTCIYYEDIIPENL